MGGCGAGGVAAIDFIQALHYTNTDGRQIDLAVVHSAEFPERPTGAEELARYFSTTDRVVSAHVSFDSNSVVRSVRDEDVAYTAPGANHDGLHGEFIGYAAQQRSDWNDPFSKAMIYEVAVPVYGRWCEAYGIPAVLLGPEDLKAQKRGLTTHEAVSLAFRLSTHTDPRAGFPLEKFVSAVREFRGGKADDGEPVRKPLPMIKFQTGRNWLTKKAQRHLRVHGFLKFEGKPDGLFDAEVERAVIAFQRNRGLDDDGIIGPDTWRKLQG